MSRIQQQQTSLEWRRFRDAETYHPLRDGPRLYRSQWAIATMERYLPPDHVALAQRLAALHERIHKGAGRDETAEYVQGGDGAANERRLLKLSAAITELAGYGAAALSGVGRDGYACFRGICLLDTQAQLCRRVGYPEGSRRSLRKLVQITMEQLIFASAHMSDDQSLIAARP